MEAVTGEDGVARCPWAAAPGDMRAYHDTEWGVPVSGEQAYFERLTLEAFQSGLSWAIILRKRPGFREAFADFDVDEIATWGETERGRLLADAGIVRNRLKVDATLANARATVALRDHGGLEAFVESYRPPAEAQPAPRATEEVPTTSEASTRLSKDLKRRGFAFVGPTTMHALMEALGLVDTHLTGCHRRGVAGRGGAVR
ncbi:DNA-3-methyladenine glycosylase I [Nocardioides lentus]|uniref:DNA-3-methyladenine glycosylase I n=1 Tax=Nocardioides lentus TaxID=338077 RepID=A0ABP5AWW8_9ACTN